MKNKNIFILLVAVFLNLVFCINSFSEDIIGEIININYDYQIAFTDLSNYYLDKGDIVEIFKDGEFVTYLEVSQSSSAISRLVPVKTSGKFKTNVEFRTIQVGSIVKKFNIKTNKKLSQSKKDSRIVEKIVEDIRTGEPKAPQDVRQKEKVSETEYQSQMPDEMAVQFKNLSDNYVILSNSLADIIQQKKSLEEENSRYRKEIQELTDSKGKEADDYCGNLKDEIKKLRKSLAILKSKLKYMSEIIQKGKE